MNDEKYKYDLFISYSEDGQAWVRGYLEPKLRRAGKTYLLEDDFNTGQNNLKEAERAITFSRKVVFVITPQHVARRGAELIELMTHTLGAEEGKWSLLPVLLKPVDPSLLQRTFRFIDLTDELGKEDAEQRLLLDVGVGNVVNIDKDEPLASPYPGMKAFEGHYIRYFFGREKQVEECLRYLRNNRFLVLIGSSGCGKSSLVRAGIMPSLQKNNDWMVKILRPSDGAFGVWFHQYSDEELVEQSKLVNHLLVEKPRSQYLLLVVDQFEEVFTFDRQDVDRKQNNLGEQAQTFLQCLAVLRRQENVSIVLTVRDEFFPQLAWCAEWLDIDTHLQRVGPLSHQGLVDAIRRPALQVGVWIDDVLIERLVNDAGEDPSILPFVQETMNLLWEQKEESFISLQQYEKLEQGGISGLRYAIAAKADAAFNALSSDVHRAIARCVFIRLVQFGQGGRPDTRRSQAVSLLQVRQGSQEIFEETLKHFTSDRYRLLTFTGQWGGQEAEVDIVHESLINAWPKLVDWVAFSREFEKQRRYFLQKAHEWDELYKRKNGFLDKGQLQYARLWLKSHHDDYENIDEILMQYVNSSLIFYRLTLAKRISVFSLVALLLPSYFLFKSIYGLNLRKEALSLNDLIEIEGGEYNVGNVSDGHGYQGTVDVIPFLIEKFEVSNEMYCLCIDAEVCYPSSKTDDICRESMKKYPVINITLNQAKDYCAWLERRLPNEIEWEVVARTKNDLVYPVGNDISQLNININKENVINKIGEIWPVDQIGDDVNPLGVSGLTGNVSEWTDSPFDFSCNNIVSLMGVNLGALNGSGAVIKGGAMRSLPEGATVFYRDSSLVENRSPNIGFRCLSSSYKSSLRNINIEECKHE